MKSMKIILVGESLLDLHTIEPDDYVIASFYVENNGDTSARYWVKLYLDGNLYRQYQSTALAPGERSSAYNIHVSSDIYGSHTVLVEVNPFDTPVTDSVIDTFTVAEIPKITKQEFYDNLMAKLGNGGTINEAVIPEEYGDSSGNQDKWCKPPTASYIGWWSSKLYKHKKVLIAILLADGCSNPPDSVDCIYFTDWSTYYTWNELPEEIVTEALDALPVTGSGKAVFDTGESSSPYPSISGVFKGKLTIKGTGYLKITDIKTRACSDATAQVTSWSISPGKGNEIKRGAEEYDIEVHLSGYPQMFHDVETIENSDGKLTFVSFTDANNNTHDKWIPSLIIEGETLPELSCSAPTPSFANGCELLLSYDKNTNGKIDINEMSIAWNDYANGVITVRELDFLWNAWEKNSINAKCPGCFSPSKVSITFVTKAEDGSELREVKLYIDGDLIGETMPSLTVELEPGKTVHVKLVKEGYRTVEFDYTVPNTAATVTKTLIAKKPDFRITNAYIMTTGDIYPGDTIELSVTIKNVGDKTDTGVIQIAWDTYPLKKYDVPSINPDQTRVISPLSFSIPENATIDTHTITVYVRPFTEMNTTDSRDISVVLKAKKPELKITNAYYSIDGGSTWTEVSRGGTAHIQTGSKPKFKVRIRNEGSASNTRCVWLRKGYGCAAVNIGAEESDKVLNYQDTEDIIIDSSSIESNQEYSLHVKDGQWIPGCPSDDEFDFYNVSYTVEVTFITKDEQGNEITGVDVYIDGVKKGTT